jgi:hypothetical protein
MNRNRLLLRIPALLTLLMAAGVTTGQEQSGDKPAPLVGMISLIVRENVQRELGIEKDSPELAEIRKLLKPFSTVLQQRLNQPSEADKADRLNAQQLYAKIESEFVLELKKLLKPEQFTRLQQIHWQRWGLQAVNVVSDELEITEDQLAILSAMKNDFETRRKEIRADAGTNKDAKIQELDTERNGKYIEILTPQQLSKFERLKGKPFEISEPNAASANSTAQALPIRTRPGGLMAFALSEPIQKELGIEKDSPVVAEIRELAETHSAELQKELRKFNPVDREKALATESKVQRKYDMELEKLLTPEQFTRLKQIHWQQLGVSALNDAEVVYELEITDEQKSQLAELELEMFQKMRQLLNPTSDRPVGVSASQEFQKRVQAVRTEQETKAEQILTQEQRELFTELKGKPFDLQLLRSQPTGRLRQAPDRQ